MFFADVGNNRVPRPGMTGVRTGEVKEEGRVHGIRSAWAAIRPGGHERGRTHVIPGSPRCTGAEPALLEALDGQSLRLEEVDL
jgi:hypothetical protein